MIDVLQSARYSIVSVGILQVYEWLLQLDDEVKYIHNSRVTTITVFYILCRYYPLLVWPFFIWAWGIDHRIKACHHVFHALYLCLIPFQMLPQAVILKRAYAFTERRKVGLIFFTSAFLVLLVLEIWAFVVQAQLNTGIFSRFCGLKSYRQAGYVSLAHFIVDLLSMGIVITHFIVQHGKDLPLARTFMHQGLGFFFLVSFLNLMNTAFWLTPGLGLSGVTFPMILILANMLACRLIVQLRKRVTPTESYQLRQCSLLVQEALRQIDEWGD